MTRPNTPWLRLVHLCSAPVLSILFQVGANHAETITPTDRAIFNVRAFGARADGVSDDTAALQAAVDRASEVAGLVRVPAGRYLVGSIELPSHVAIEGDGEASVLLLRPQPLAKGGAEPRSPIRPGHMFLPKNMTTIPSVEDVRISHLTLLGNSREQNAGGPMPLSGAIHGIAILGGVHWIVNDVHVEDFDGDGIYLGANLVYPGARDAGNGKLSWPSGQAPDRQPMAIGNIIEKSIARGNLRNGMMIAHGDSNTLRGNLFEGNQLGIVCVPRPGPDRHCAAPEAYPKFAPGVYESAELDLEPNRIKALPGASVIWQQVTNTLVEGNTFRAGPRLAIQIVKGSADISNNRIVHNTFIDNLGGGIIIFAPGARYNTIEDNDFIWSKEAYQTSVVRIHAGDGNRVLENRFRGPLPASGHVVLLEAASRWHTTRCVAFINNLVDVPSEMNAPLVVLDRTLVDSAVAGNRFPSGGRVDAAPGSLLGQGIGSTCGL